MEDVNSRKFPIYQQRLSHGIHSRKQQPNNGTSRSNEKMISLGKDHVLLRDIKIKMEKEEYPDNTSRAMDNFWNMTSDKCSNSKAGCVNKNIIKEKDSDLTNHSVINRPSLCTDNDDNIEHIPGNINSPSCEPFPVQIHQNVPSLHSVIKTENAGNNSEQIYSSDNATLMEKSKHSENDFYDQTRMETLPYKSYNNTEFMWKSVEDEGLVTTDTNLKKAKYLKKRRSKPEAIMPSFPCQHCDKCFSRSDYLNLHVMKYHRFDEVYVCEECGIGFPTRYKLNMHIIIHTNIGQFVCDDCGQAFGRKCDLRMHLTSHAGKSFVCKECFKGFSQRSGLETHMMIHAKERPFMCLECGKTFCQEESLKTHVLIHSKEKPIEHQESSKEYGQTVLLKEHILSRTCDYCGEVFIRKGDLKIHMVMTHTSRPFVCKECGKGFSQKGGLKTHMMIHTKVRPFVCQECGKGFCQKGNLKTHMLTHTNERPFVCEECGKGFYQKGNLKAHMKTHGK
ncbi:uncharacterized protein LOC144434099 [Glandiceps talaboti]